MDFFFHAVLPYFLGSFLRLEKKLLAALVLGGIAPDLDVFIAWINNIYPTTFLLVHRGITHTLFFGFFFALMLLYLCTRGPVKGYLGRFIKFDLKFSLISMAFVYAGVLIHLLVDFTTTRGVPVFYPWQSLRYSVEIFSQLEMSVLIASLLVLAVLVKERSRTTFNKNLGIIFLVFFLIIGGIRMEGKEAAQSFFEGTGLQVHPDFDLFYWAAVDSDSHQFKVYRFDLLQGNLSRESAYPRLLVASSLEEAKVAIAAAEELPQVKLFRWRAFAVA
ncbi:MAG: metal-dependent hydrolase, partial [Methanothrix sp.]|nr:metal-dependent hydrolase [Methanothrix sp.]